MYRIVLDEETEAQIDALPYEALAPLAGLLDVLPITPWNGDALNADSLTHRCVHGRSVEPGF